MGGWRKEKGTRLTKKQLIQAILCELDVGGWRKEKGTRLTHFTSNLPRTDYVVSIFVFIFVFTEDGGLVRVHHLLL